MATEKQIKANQANAKKSTGAKTPEGKAVVAANPIKHGLLSRHLILEGENPEDYHALLDDLMNSLNPHGTLERVLVDKIAAAIWRQMRLAKAESASIELGRRTEQGIVRDKIEKALAIDWQQGHLTDSDFVPLNDEDVSHIEWCNKVLIEYQALDDEVLDDYQLERLKKGAPEMYGQLVADYPSLDNLRVQMVGDDTSLHEWADYLSDYCNGIIKQHKRKPQVQLIAKQVQASMAAPISNELLIRYQVALDAELYKAIEALRKQQEFRLKVGIEIEAEAA